VGSAADIISSAAWSYSIAKWHDHGYYVEVWIKKEALSGIFEGICEELDVTFICCRGYMSPSEMWAAATG
jgi:hypothetical protein